MAEAPPPARAPHRPRQGLRRQLMTSFTLFTLGVSAVLGLFAVAFVYSVEDRFIEGTLSGAAETMQRQRQDTGRWPAPPQRFMQRHDTPATLPDDLRSAWQAHPRQREFAGAQGRHYHLHWLGRPRGAAPDPPVPDARHPLLVAEVSGLLVVRPARGELLAWWTAGSGGLALAALGLAAWRARRISAPLARLADTVARSRPGDTTIRHAAAADATPDRRDDEVALLARHLDALTARTQAFLEREQRFTRDVSHELRTPLTVLGMASERLLSRPDLPADAAAELKRMRQVLWDLEQTAHTLLALARESQVAAARPDATAGVALLPALERVVLEQAPRLQDKDMPLDIDVSPALQVDLPPGVLHILLSNLVGNAFSHGEPGPMRVAADTEGLQVHNRSTAWPPGLGDRLGKPFQKGAASAGFGLGLSIVHRLAEHEGLKLRLEEADGRTCVRLMWRGRARLAAGAR